MACPTDDFTTLLRAFAGEVDLIWEQYEGRGPGAVDSALFEPVERLAGQLTTMLNDPLLDDVDRLTLERAILQATDFARRCAAFPQGLCFISGEAGLVPRRDQIDAFAAARATVRFAVQQVDGA